MAQYLHIFDKDAKPQEEKRKLTSSTRIVNTHRCTRRSEWHSVEKQSSSMTALLWIAVHAFFDTELVR